MSTWNILYRGSLSSCNYACGYCPFAKTANTVAELRQDELELERFVAWTELQTRRIGILITPWGEGLVHRYYRKALVALSHLPRVHRVSIQTNLSAPLEDLAPANRETLALWATFHPTETSLEAFAARCRELDAARIRYSVGVVGLREQFEAITELRAVLHPDVYLWINAFKRDAGYYRAAEVEQLSAIDPYFHWNLHRYESLGKACAAGETSFTVDGRGDVRRCHFVDGVIGNIYEADFERCLKRRGCPAATCGCHIGYVHRPELKLDELYGVGLLERIPSGWPVVNPRFAGSLRMLLASR
ncbi:MAG TPA: STM4011 family radical SAM protein [Candidatus Dormibacteraeota bacterium]|nr:STM4011 family radical SAM protein [Candidatus Dormibacteraeota bacterium]